MSAPWEHYLRSKLKEFGDGDDDDRDCRIHARTGTHTHAPRNRARVVKESYFRFFVLNVPLSLACARARGSSQYSGHTIRPSAITGRVITWSGKTFGEDHSERSRNLTLGAAAPWETDGDYSLPASRRSRRRSRSSSSTGFDRISISVYKNLETKLTAACDRSEQRVKTSARELLCVETPGRSVRNPPFEIRNRQRRSRPHPVIPGGGDVAPDELPL